MRIQAAQTALSARRFDDEVVRAKTVFGTSRELRKCHEIVRSDFPASSLEDRYQRVFVGHALACNVTTDSCLALADALAKFVMGDIFGAKPVSEFHSW